jgi:hypothetical protein
MFGQQTWTAPQGHTPRHHVPYRAPSFLIQRHGAPSIVPWASSHPLFQRVHRRIFAAPDFNPHPQVERFGSIDFPLHIESHPGHLLRPFAQLRLIGIPLV